MVAGANICTLTAGFIRLPGHGHGKIYFPQSTCKRLNMFLSWMVRQDKKGVDFGLWKNIKPSQLLMPLDVHVDRVGRRLNLITRKQTDWRTVVELTTNLKAYDPKDPVKYDFALFGIGVLEKHDGLK